MLKYQKLETDHKLCSIAEAIELLLTIPGFDKGGFATIDIRELPLPNGQIAGMPLVQYDGLLSEVVHYFWLATSTAFEAIPKCSDDRQQYEIFRLNGARFSCEGSLTLSDGSILRAVQIQPVHLPLQPSELSWRIIHHVVVLTKSQDRCYRKLSEAVRHTCKELKDARFLDGSTLNSINVPSLKRIKAHIAKHDWSLKALSTQTIADALRQFGLRLPKARPRRKRRQDSATI